MNIDQQVISLEYAKRLKKLDVKQKSIFCWIGIEKENIITYAITYFTELFKENSINEIYSAFSVSELLALLPHRITTKEKEPFNSYRLRIEKSLKIVGEKYEPNVFILLDENIKYNYVINYYSDTTSQEMDWMFKSLNKNMTNENCANALAKMVIFLIESDLLNVKDS